MLFEKLCAEYSSLLQDFMENQGPESLSKAAKMGQKMSDCGVSPEEIANIHKIAISKHNTQNVSVNSQDSTTNSSLPLLELLTAYGLALREKEEERVRAENALKKSEERYRRLVECSPDGIAIHCDGTVLYANPAMAEMLGGTPEEFLGQSIWRFVHPDYHDAVRKRIERSLALGNGGERMEETLLKLDGTPVEVDVTGVPFDHDGKGAIQVYVRDIGESKQLEADRIRLATAIEQAREIVLITNADGVIEYVNPEFETVTGYSKKEAIGRTPRLLKSGEQDADFYEDLWRTISGGNTWSGRLVNKKKDGTLYTEEATISPVLNPSGEIISYVAVKRDVTKELKLVEQFRQAQKMEAIGRLAGGVAHDFNNMLSVILGYGDRLLGELRETDPRRESVHQIMAAGERSADLTRQLLAFSRKQALKPQVLNLNDVITDLNRMLHRLIGEDIELTTRLADDLYRVRVDPVQVEQVVMNLAVNARDAMPDGGKLLIETANVELDAEYVEDHCGVAPGQYVLVAVTDTGCGMEAETVSRIFEPFFTTKGLGRGTGLGLSTVYGIVRQSGGTVWVYSEPGHGTTFKIYFPRTRGPATARRPAPKAEKAVERPGARILVVEDEPVLLKLLKEILVGEGYDVSAAGNPDDAIEIVETRGYCPDILITDVVLPKMNGRKLADRIKKTCPDTRVLYMSGYTDNVVVHHGILDPGIPFLEKPISVSKIKSVVAALISSPHEEQGRGTT